MLKALLQRFCYQKRTKICFYGTICHAVSIQIFTNVFALMYIKAIQVQLSTRKMRRHPIFVVDSNSLSIDLRLLSCPNLALKPLYLVGTVGRSHSMLRGTLIIWHARAISCFLSACTRSKAQLNIGLNTFALTWCGNIFVACSMNQPFFRQITFF